MSDTRKPPSRARRVLRFLLISLGLLLLATAIYIGIRAWSYGATGDLPLESWRPSSAVLWARVHDAYGAWTRLSDTPLYTGPRGPGALRSSLESAAPPIAPVLAWFDADHLVREFGGDLFVAARPVPAGAGVGPDTPPEMLAVTRLPFRYYCLEPGLSMAWAAGLSVSSQSVNGRTIRCLTQGPNRIWTCSTGNCFAVATSEEMMKQAVTAAFPPSASEARPAEPLPAPGPDEVCSFGIRIDAIPANSPWQAKYQTLVRSIPVAEFLHPTDPRAVRDFNGTLSLAPEQLCIEGKARLALDRAEPRIRAQHALPPKVPELLAMFPEKPIMIETLRTDVSSSWPWTRDTIVNVIQRASFDPGDPGAADAAKAVYGLLNAFLEPFDREGVHQHVFPYLGPDFAIALAPGSEERSGRRPLLVLGLMTQVQEPLTFLQTMDEFIRKVGAGDPGGPLKLEPMTVGPYEAHVLKTHFEKFGELCYGVIDGWLVITSSLDYFAEIVDTRLGSRSSAATQEEISSAAAEARRHGTHLFAYVDGAGIRGTMLDFREEASRILTDRIDRREVRARIEKEVAAGGRSRGREFDEIVDQRVQDYITKKQIEARRDIEKKVQGLGWLRSTSVTYRCQGPVGQLRLTVRFSPARKGQ
ncbi:MAG: hypothetical protein HYY93_02160 [Planctomycetes bacterium]|nr:hypothetical protein [Planctomycetota bacterium]